MMETAVTVNNVSFSYFHSAHARSFLAGSKKGRTHRKALRNVSFTIGKGEVLGIVGLNGSGKSTLMQIIAGTLLPDQGFVDLHGNDISLLSLGIGFKTSLSGIDNIYLSGLLLGFSGKEIRDKLDRIIAFSELGEAISRPVNTYSKGMRSRLSFSIATELQTDILLLDEVFAVGDVRFRRKSSAKMHEMIRQEGRTVVIVAHSGASLRKHCDRVLWLEHGSVRMLGAANEVIDAYMETHDSVPDDEQTRDDSSMPDFDMDTLDTLDALLD